MPRCRYFSRKAETHGSVLDAFGLLTARRCADVCHNESTSYLKHLNHVSVSMFKPHQDHTDRFNGALKTLEDGCGSNRHAEENHDRLKEARNTTSSETRTDGTRTLRRGRRRAMSWQRRHNRGSVWFSHPEALDVDPFKLSARSRTRSGSCQRTETTSQHAGKLLLRTKTRSEIVLC